MTSFAQAGQTADREILFSEHEADDKSMRGHEPHRIALRHPDYLHPCRSLSRGDCQGVRQDKTFPGRNVVADLLQTANG